jgi:hypothetical protein
MKTNRLLQFASLMFILFSFLFFPVRCDAKGKMMLVKDAVGGGRTCTIV